MKKGICPKCGREGELTKDHRIPKAIGKVLHYLEVKHWKKLISRPENIQYICSPCNNKKGNKLDLKDPRVQMVRKIIHKELDKGKQLPSKYMRLIKAYTTYLK